MLCAQYGLGLILVYLEASLGLGWVGSWLASEAGSSSHGQCVLPSLARLGPTPAVWSHSPPGLLTRPEPHQGAGRREMPPCLRVFRACRGSL